MISDRVGEKNIFNHIRHAQKRKMDKRNFSVGDTVLVLQNEIVRVFKNSSGHVRSVKLRIRKIRSSGEGNRILERPLPNIVLLVKQ